MTLRIYMIQILKKQKRKEEKGREGEREEERKRRKDKDKEKEKRKEKERAAKLYQPRGERWRRQAREPMSPPAIPADCSRPQTPRCARMLPASWPWEEEVMDGRTQEVGDRHPGR